MYVRSLAIEGLSDLPRFKADSLGREVVIHGPSPAASAVGDGLSLLFGALNESVLRSLLQRWGLAQAGEDVEIESTPLPIQASWADRLGARALITDTTRRRIHVAADIELDPLMAADLRAAAGGEPRLAVGLSSAPLVHVAVSAFFAASWDVLSISVQAVVIGGERFPSQGPERAAWLTRLLQRLGERYTSHDESALHAERTLAAMVSAAPSEHKNYCRWSSLVETCADNVRPAQRGESGALLLAEDRPITRLGSKTVRKIHVATTATLSGADVLWMGQPDPWETQLTSADDAPLEQLWSVAEDGDINPSNASPPRSVLRFEASEE
jgi:hypothetical protein